MNPTIILISSNAEDRQFVDEVASRAGLPILQFCEAATAAAQTAALAEKLVFVDVSTEEHLLAFKAAYSSQIGLGKGRINPNFLHFITFDTPESMRLMSRSNLLGHFIVRNYGSPAEAGRHYGRLVHGLCQGLGFALDKLIPPPANVKVIKLKHSREKQDAIDTITEFLSQETDFKGRQVSLIVNAVDELLMNAIYDAPTDETGGQELRSVKRDTPLELGEDRSVEMQIGFDGEYAAITVVDRFGSIDKVKLLGHILDNYAKNTLFRPDSADAGAGIGLATTFKLGGSLFFVQEPGEKTEATVFFRQASTFKEFRNQFRFISIHVAPDGEA